MAADPKTYFDGAVELLKAGPLGLAALLLVLTAITLLARVDERKERLLRQFLYVGAFCFLVSSVLLFFTPKTASEHLLHFSVYPNDLETRSLPAPAIKVNGVKLQEPPAFKIKSEATAIIDVSAAIDFVSKYEVRDRERTETLNQVSFTAEETSHNLEKLKRITELALSDACPGGSHGFPSQYGSQIASLTNAVAANLSRTVQTVDQALRTPAPQP